MPFFPLTKGLNEHLIVRSLRVPRTLIGLGLGVVRACRGAVVQGITRNPLAGPGNLGVNAGAALAVVISIHALADRRATLQITPPASRWRAGKDLTVVMGHLPVGPGNPGGLSGDPPPRDGRVVAAGGQAARTGALWWDSKVVRRCRALGDGRLRAGGGRHGRRGDSTRSGPTAPRSAEPDQTKARRPRMDA